jgi:hypothetical protein
LIGGLNLGCKISKNPELKVLFLPLPGPDVNDDEKSD